MKIRIYALVVVLMILGVLVGNARERTGNKARRDATRVFKGGRLEELRWALNPGNIDTVFPNMNAEQRKLLRIQTKVLRALAREYIEVE